MLSNSGGGFIAGLISWLFLNRRSVRGDYALVFYTVSSSILYYFLKSNSEIDSPFKVTLHIASIYFASLILCTVIYRVSPYHPLARYPGPFIWKISSIVLAVVTLGGRKQTVLDELHKKYGRYIRIGPNVLSVNSLTANSIIYSSAHCMEKSDSYNTPGHYGGVSLFFKHKREESAKRKRIWLNAFTGSGAENFSSPLNKRTLQLLDCIERNGDANGIVNIGLCLSFWSYDFMGDLVFGGCNNLNLMEYGDPDGLVDGGKKATVVFDSVGQIPWLMDIIWHIPFGRAIHRLRDRSAAMMHKRIQSNDVQIRDLCSYLIDGESHSKERIPVSDLNVDSLVAIQGGSDNTGPAISLAIFFMLANPPTFKTLQAELDHVFFESELSATLNSEKLTNSPYLNAVISETMRLGSSFYLPRVVPSSGATIDGNFIPGGTVVALAAYSQQIAEENFYPDPLSFRPERWLPGGLGPEQVFNKAATFTFSSGPFACVAKNFAVHKIRVVLARLALHFDMTFAPDFDADTFMKGVKNIRTVYFDRPLMVKTTRRRSKINIV